MAYEGRFGAEFAGVGGLAGRGIGRAAWRLAVAALLAAASPGASAGPAGPGADGGSSGNLLPNADFELGDVPRPVCTPAGMDHHRRPVARAFASRAARGERCLALADASPRLWQVLARTAGKAVFSVYLRAPADGRAVIALEPVKLGGYSANPAETATKAVAVGPAWKRYEVGVSLDEQFVGRWGFECALYRCWVRSPDGGRLFVDAAQLETGVLEATPFQPARGGYDGFPGGAHSLRGDLRAILLDTDVERITDIPDVSAKRSRSGEVALRVLEPDGRARRDEPVWGGVPFPEGELFHARDAVVLDAGGRAVPFQARVLARRPKDGSVTSLLVDLRATVAAGGGADYVLRYGPDAGGDAGDRPAPLCRRDGEAVMIDTGATRVRLDPAGGALFDELRRGPHRLAGGESRALDLAGAAHSSSAEPPTHMAIERNGPLHAVVRLYGRHVGDDGEALLHYELRLHAFRGKRYLLIEYGFENQQRALGTAVGGVALRLPTRANVEAAFATDAGALRSRVPARLTQLRELYGAGTYRLRLDGPAGREAHDGRRATGAVRSAGAVTVRDLSRLSPKAVAVAREHIDVELWPTRDCHAIDLPFGMAGHVAIAYDPWGGGGDDGNALAAGAMILRADPRWMARSGAFSDFLTADETARYAPRYHRLNEAYFDGIRHERETVGLDSMFHRGALGRPSMWCNNETEYVRALWLQYLRTGQAHWHRLATDATLHQREVDVIHARETDVGGRSMHTHQGGAHTNFNVHTGHYWITGMIWQYLLTGDLRTLDVVTDLSAPLIHKHTVDTYKGRERGRLLLHLADLYELTGIRGFREAYERQYGFGQPTGESGYYAALGLNCVRRWYEVTGERRYLRRLGADAEAVRQHYVNARAEMDDPSGNAALPGQGRHWGIFTAMGAAGALLDDPRYPRAVEKFLPWMITHLSGRDFNMVRGAEFFASAKRLGLRESPLMPEHLLGVSQFSGRYFGGSIAIDKDKGNAFRARIAADGTAPLTVSLYRLSKFRYRKGPTPRLTYRLTAPGGAVVDEGVVTGPLHGKLERLVVEKPAQGVYELAFAMHRNCWAAVGCSLPTVALDAARGYAFRGNGSGSGTSTFTCRAPARGPLRVTILWPETPRRGGRAIGVRVAGEDGTLIGRRRWAATLGTAWGAGGRPVLQPASDGPFDFAIPASRRGRPLHLTVTCEKWTGFRVEGLDDPWLVPGHVPADVLDATLDAPRAGK